MGLEEQKRILDYRPTWNYTAFEEVAGTAQVPEVTIEAAVDRRAALMPLAGHQRRITTKLHPFGDCHAIRELADADRRMILATEQSRPGRFALGTVIKLRKPQAAGGKPVEIRRLDLAAIATEIREPHVVDHDQHDIWAFVGG